ncbi:hypothetical protein M0R04_14230 [Candidatus Dojkabacteria bacterium]|jgi:hypothetical protein|nr:hypothetical protein [Candidatus Dojkabacteria bacterium]
MICPAGEGDIPDKDYENHMATVHGGVTQLEGIKQEKSKKQDIPKLVALDKEAPIPPEIQEVLQAIDNPKKEEPKPVAEKPAEVNQEPKKLELKYKWEGNCPQCSTPVRTVITKIDKRWFASAMCLTHEVLEQREVTPLEENKK